MESDATRRSTCGTRDGLAEPTPVVLQRVVPAWWPMEAGVRTVDVIERVREGLRRGIDPGLAADVE
ncbi:hypothetical protein K7472_21020 [Streptomyces sp. PTM05]|uniref:Uncharacterized protein n=1 Tax=Streptantibioticus parmotrematis TaxID=2873249 RepID=A0ABS7QVQ8_9ACTN|nr:hypothetical protein [Streptantibioticus parmotrematis]MBY8887301.1 hypothetical protein [Streptantibioticus parmotrematis]